MGSEGNDKDRLIQALRVEVRQQQSSLQDIEAALHDGPMQRVIAAHMQLQALLASPELTNERLQDLESIDQMLKKAIEQTREIIGGGSSAEVALDGIDDLEKLCLSLTSDCFTVRLVADDDVGTNTSGTAGPNPVTDTRGRLEFKKAQWCGRRVCDAVRRVAYRRNIHRRSRVRLCGGTRGCG